MTYVAETKQKAEDEGIEHIRYFFEDALRTTPEFLAPPGYLSIEQLKMRAALADKLHGKFDFDAVNEAFFVAVGTPDQVVDQLGEWGETMGTNHFNLMARCRQHAALEGDQEHQLIAEEVIPRVRATAPVARLAAAE